MDSLVKIFISRSLTELNAAKVMFILSNDDDKKVLFEIRKEETFFSAVISHTYYAIFYAAKAFLLMKGIKTS